MRLRHCSFMQEHSFGQSSHALSTHAIQARHPCLQLPCFILSDRGLHVRRASRTRPKPSASGRKTGLFAGGRGREMPSSKATCGHDRTSTFRNQVTRKHYLDPLPSLRGYVSITRRKETVAKVMPASVKGPYGTVDVLEWVLRGQTIRASYLPS